jgi:starch phosphorylase
LSRNLWWTWNQEAQDFFYDLSPRGWQNLFHNAVAVLREVSEYELRVHLQDTEFAARVRAVLQDFENYLSDQIPGATRTRPSCTKIRSLISPPSSACTNRCPLRRAASASSPATTPNPPATRPRLCRHRPCSIAKVISSRPLIPTTGRRNTTIPLTRTTSRSNLCSTPNGERLVCTVEIGMNDVDFSSLARERRRVPVYLLDTNLPENEQLSAT